MRIGILSNTPNAYSTIRLKEAARARDHKVRVLSSSNFSIEVRSKAPNLLYKEASLSKFDAIIPRIGSSRDEHRIAILRQFEQMGTFCLSSSLSVSLASDKLRTLQVLSRHNIEIPASTFVFGSGDIDPALERVGGAPVVIKLLEGSAGSGVMLAETKAVAKAIIEGLQIAGHNVLIQQFVAESKGRDIRAFVIGDKVVASMRRIAKEGEFRSNVHLGATTEPFELPPEYERVALLATHILGLGVAGVDLLESAAGPQVVEVNSSPGLEGIEGCTKIDIATAIITYLEEQAQFPDLDLRERLALGKGYAVVELPISKRSPHIGKPLSDIILHEQEVQVLSIIRKGVTLPLPRGEELLSVGDKILCFGKKTILQGMLPAPRSKKTS